MRFVMLKHRNGEPIYVNCAWEQLPYEAEGGAK